jgi:CHAT domain-containing protein
MEVPSGKSNEDGLLEAWEIMNLDLKADLVVLSACETARGRIGDGEGVIGLSWALFVAGCPTAVVSQWKVESSSTTSLMVEVHKKYRTRFDSPQSALSAAEAIRQSSLKLMKDRQYQHPFYRGGFVIVGDEY